ncbi:Brp/Blh family beta-carotene 15,15'-dioxygenase [Candidatus Pelagibacter sp.]|nr:Brp/Blh family beta-carotene 15,15'-dioxygenase [Candidatus Pelagibacter sp.]
MDNFELSNLEFKHSILFTVLVIILLGVFIFPNQEFESLDWKIIKNNPIINNDTTNVICFFLIATLGVSHGSLDNYKGKKLLKFYSLKNSIIFYLSYIFIVFFIILLWKVLPTTTLFIFLIIAAYHFGKEDSLEKLRKSNFKLLYYFSRGSIIILAPLAFHSNETIEIFRIISSATFADYLFNLEKYYFFKLMLGLAILSSFTISGKEYASFYFEIPSILAMNYFFTPFFAFTIYFCFLHSVRHIISLSSELDKKDIKKGLNMFFNKALPLSLITAIIFIIALYFLLDLNQLDEAIFKVIFIGLASLTFPHILLEYLLEKNEK